MEGRKALPFCFLLTTNSRPLHITLHLGFAANRESMAGQQGLNSMAEKRNLECGQRRK